MTPLLASNMIESVLQTCIDALRMLLPCRGWLVANINVPSLLIPTPECCFLQGSWTPSSPRSILPITHPRKPRGIPPTV